MGGWPRGGVVACGAAGRVSPSVTGLGLDVFRVLCISISVLTLQGRLLEKFLYFCLVVMHAFSVGVINARQVLLGFHPLYNTLNAY